MELFVLYFDPGLGAMIVQAIVAVIAGFLLFSKNLITRIKLFFGMENSKGHELFDDFDSENSKLETKENSEKK